MTKSETDSYILKKLDTISELYPTTFYTAVEMTAQKLNKLIGFDLISDYMLEARYIRQLLLESIRDLMSEDLYRRVWECD